MERKDGADAQEKVYPQLLVFPAIFGLNRDTTHAPRCTYITQHAIYYA